MAESYKILHLCSTLDRGGIATFVKELCSLNDSSKLVHHDVLTIQQNADKYKTFEVYDFSNHWKRSGFTKALRKISSEYDVLMFHLYHPAIICPFIRQRSKKILLFQHGMSLGSAPLAKRWIKVGWYRILPSLLSARVIASTAYAFKKSASRGISFDLADCLIIPFGTRMIRREKYQKIEGCRSINVGTAATFASIKRIDWLIKSFAEYNGEHIINVKIAGDGPLRENLHELAKGIHSTKVKFEFTGYQSDMYQFYDALDLFVFPSHSESFGLVVLEALFRNCPVIAFEDVGGALEVLQNNSSIILRPTISDLAELWPILDEHPEIIDEMKKNIFESELDGWKIEKTRLRIDELISVNMR